MVGEKENGCITLHQPWASLLVHGIKRIEGRSWACPVRGRLWIHAASKIPEREIIEAMEEFYRDAYELDGVTDIVFPEHYPTSVLLESTLEVYTIHFCDVVKTTRSTSQYTKIIAGLRCVDVVGCLYREEVEHWDEISPGVRMEAQTELCWLCENPQKLVIPLEMRGRQRVYNLQNRMLDVAPRALRPARGPAPVKFPSLDPSNLFSLVPGCLKGIQTIAGKTPLVTTPSPKLNASIAGARAAASQFRKQDDRAKQQASANFSNLSSAGLANLHKPSFHDGQNISGNIADRRETGKNLKDDRGRSQSRPINASRRAPRRVPACRIFEQAVGALSPRVLRQDQNLKAGGGVDNYPAV